MRPVTNWHNAVAHIDADGFYAGCEAIRHPELKGRPICVLSNQNAFVVAKSYDAKALGVKTCMSVYDARKIAPDAAYLSPDFRYYGQISEKMFSILHRYSPDIEPYSIDEGFMDMNGIRTLWHKGYRQISDDIRKSVQREIGITVSVGVANTKTLAKMASESNKPNGTTVIPGKRIERFLISVPVNEIPGIGCNREALLHKFNIRSAYNFARADEGLIRKLLGRHGLTLWYELNGQPVLPVEVGAHLPKSVSRTASLGEVTDNRTTLAAHLSHHAIRLTSELVARNLLAKQIHVFLSLKSFESDRIDTRLDFPTNAFSKIMKTAKKALQALYREDTLYRGCGLIATHLSRQALATEDLFGFMREDVRQGKLMLTVNEINRKYGNHTVAPGATLHIRKTGRRVRFQYPVISQGVTVDKGDTSEWH